MESKTQRNPKTYGNIKKLLTTFLKQEFGGFPSDTHFYTPKEWRDRGEKYGLGGLLNMSFEGELYSRFHYAMDRGHFQEKFLTKLKSIHPDLWYEFGYQWSLTVYEN